METEIREYGEKYASAVKAFSIIDGVDKALGRLNRNAQSIERQNSDDINQVEREIEGIRSTISNSIANAKKGREIGINDPIPKEVAKRLHLDAESITNFVEIPVDGRIDEILLGFWQKVGKKIATWVDKEYNPSETAWDSSKQTAIESVIDDVLGDYTENFRTERGKILTKLRDDFIEDVKKSVSESGELSDDAKNYILDIETPEVDEFTGSYEFGELYKQKKRTKKVLWVDKEILDRESFIKELNKKLIKVTGELADNYKKNYVDSLNGLLRKVESEFNLNMEKYSVSLKAKLEDKEAMEELKDKIMDAVSELHACQEKLNSVIWEVK